MSEGTAADQFFHQTARMQSGSPGRVKRPSESYSVDRPVGLQKSTGRPWRNTPGVGVGDHPIFGGKDAALPSEKDYAMLGAIAKLRASRQLKYADVMLSDHEVALVREACETESWSGEVDGRWVADYGRLPRRRPRQGGFGWYDEWGFVPESRVFRQCDCHLPVVARRARVLRRYSGRSPRIVDRDGRCEQPHRDVEPGGGQRDRPVRHDGFDMVAIEIGRDVLADSAVNLGRIIATSIGERILSELDNQIANGDGTTEPEGIFTASGTTAVASESGTASAYSVGDVERHVFGVDKQYRVNAWNPRFVMSDVAYRRMSQVPVGASDARRVLHPQMDHESYTLMGRGVSIQNNIANGYSAFASLKKAYRLWRRQGAEMRWSEEGVTLMRANTALLAVRARFGGKVIDPNAVAVMSDGDSTDG